MSKNTQSHHIFEIGKSPLEKKVIGLGEMQNGGRCILAHKTKDAR